MQLGDARVGKMADNIVGFARTLRRAGFPMDSERISVALESALLIGLDDKQDFRAALEATMVCRQQDREVFEQLFDAYFRNPELTQHLLAQMLPKTTEAAPSPKRRARTQEALAAIILNNSKASVEEDTIDFDAAMTASAQVRLRHADFESLSASEFKLVQRLACEIPLPWPRVPARRTQRSRSGARVDWAHTLRESARLDGELLSLPYLARRTQALPVLILIDVSGSMERYARLMLAFLHQSTRGLARSVYAFGNQLTELNSAFRHADSDVMLATANELIQDFAGGTQIGHSLEQLRLTQHRQLIGRRTVVLLITDGLDTGEPTALAQELAWLKRNCRSLLWLNPLLRFEHYAPSAGGASVLKKYADGMLAIHDLAHLEDLAQSLAELVKQ
ncbi:VWA domain-containing protein [Alcaligenaceae bacterium LF4-65]|uniref:VWA domain-containing protein n=1 Tax=Zwartia hollandica TaxID=324606 RepID=A0A953NB81_9BURK|nr:VWA domain-containing protein [Zwartia hollandica]MBZ1351158.1 VWA domain-containing protein [Zwartia hollandica]